MSCCSHRSDDHGCFKVVDLSGSWREMGRAYGAVLADRICGAYEYAIEQCVFADGKMSRERAEEIAASHIANYPHRLKELLTGMSETSGLKHEQHVLLNAIEPLMYDATRHSPDMPSMHSTGIAVWGEYAQSSLIYGRNWDWLPSLRKLAEMSVVSIFHPSDGSLALASIGFPGTLALSNGINERGLFIEINDGEPSGGALTYHNRIPAGVELFMFLLDSHDIDQLESFFYTTRANRACIVGAADDKTARCYEWPVFDVKRRLSVRRPGLMVATNHFTEPSWGLPRPDDDVFLNTRMRRQNLLNLAEHFKGSVDVTRMKKMLDTRLEDLGASSDNTVYQMIATPDTLTVSLKIPESCGWTDIPLGEYLKKN